MTSMEIVNEVVRLRGQLSIAHRRIKKLSAERDQFATERDQVRSFLDDALDRARQQYEALDAAEAATRRPTAEHAPEAESEPTAIVGLQLGFSADDVRELVRKINEATGDGVRIVVDSMAEARRAYAEAQEKARTEDADIRHADELIRLWRAYQTKRQIADELPNSPARAVNAGIAHGRFIHELGKAPEAVVERLLAAISVSTEDRANGA